VGSLSGRELTFGCPEGSFRIKIAFPISDQHFLDYEEFVTQQPYDKRKEAAIRGYNRLVKEYSKPPATRQPPKLAKKTARFKSGEEFDMSPIEWGWDNHFCIGLNALVGNGGVGKSSLAVWLGSQFYHGNLPGKYYGTKIKTLFYDLVEHGENTTRFQMEAYKVPHDCYGVFEVSTGIQTVEESLNDGTLEEVLEEDPTIKFIVIENMTGLFSKNNKYDAQITAFILTKFTELAKKYGLCVILNMHKRKSSSADIGASIMGSNSFYTSVRTVWFYEKDKDSGERIIFQDKNNPGEEIESPYRVEGEMTKVFGFQNIFKITDCVAITDETKDDFQARNNKAKRDIQEGTRASATGPRLSTIDKVKAILQMPCYAGVALADTVKQEVDGSPGAIQNVVSKAEDIVSCKVPNADGSMRYAKNIWYMASMYDDDAHAITAFTTRDSATEPKGKRVDNPFED
jgi:hypothetical protein